MIGEPTAHELERLRFLERMRGELDALIAEPELATAEAMDLQALRFLARAELMREEAKPARWEELTNG